MPRARPQLSITLPRNFQFHYTEGNEPKTPENEVPANPPRSPRAEGAYRIKRRSRPAVNTVFSNSSARRPIFSDVPIPTIETPISNEPVRPPLQHASTGPARGYLAPRKFMTLPRTPSPTPCKVLLAHDWDSHKDIGESISRPMSSCSLISDSSDDNDSLISNPGGDGSCTSPESDSPDPFSSRFASMKRGKGKQIAALLGREGTMRETIPAKSMKSVLWTTDMDQHLWSTYLIYLQDPTVTPFKMLPGTSPPLGVCHRVAREARRSWRPVRNNKRKASELLSPATAEKPLKSGAPGQDLNTRPGSPDTIKASRSGSNTPTDLMPLAHIPHVSSSWPKSGSSTRRRLRYLSKRKSFIAPHYQRIMQSRSPSPFSSSSRTQSRSQSRLSEVTSPDTIQATSSFNTRDIQLSLTTSTAVTMQPDGPLAQLSQGAALPLSQPDNGEWFNEPPVPFASEPPIPSDIIEPEHEAMDVREHSEDTPRLGSPFNGFHTWGPSRSKQRVRPSTARIQSSDASTMGPSLRSPVHLHETFPYQGANKRRARHELEDELSPVASSMQQSLLDNLFRTPPEGRHRRVRSRGFSLGDVAPPNSVALMFTPPSSDNGNTPMADAPRTPSTSSQVQAEPVTPLTHVRRLGSPFHGIAPRPQRARGPSRHIATASLDHHDVSAFHSIGETLHQDEMRDQARAESPRSTTTTTTRTINP